MPAALEVDHEQVKVVAIQVGYREAARQFEIPESTILSWAKREGWSEQVRKAMKAKELLIEKQGLQSVAIKSASDVMVNLKDKSKLFLAATVCKTAQSLHEQGDTELRKNTQGLKNVTGAWKDLHQDVQGSLTQVNVNVAGMRFDDSQK